VNYLVGSGKVEPEFGTPENHHCCSTKPSLPIENVVRSNDFKYWMLVDIALSKSKCQR